MNKARIQVPSTFPGPIAGGRVQQSQRRQRRSVEAILQEATNPLEEAVYAVNRIGGLKLRIARVLSSLSPQAQAMVRTQFPELANLLPQ